MKFFKVRNSLRFQKILYVTSTLFFLTAKTFSQTTGPVSAPTALPAGPTTTGAATTTATPNGTGTQTRTFANDPGAVRTLELTPAEQKAVAKEDSTRLAMIAEAEADDELMAIRRRIFGFKLFNTVNFDPNAAINIPTPNNYVLGANDRLIIDIYGYAADHIEATVNPDGFVTLPRAGVVRVAGLPMDDAKQKIASALSKFYAGLSSTGSGGMTNINISLGNVRTIRVHVTGEVIAPGTYTATSLTSLLNILYVCGGPNEIGSYRQVRVIRNNKVAATLDLYDILIKGYSNNNILLKDQDIIQVGTFVSRVAVEGNTKRAGLFEMLPHQRLIDLIDYAGGFNQYAYSNRVKVYRNTSRDRRIVDVLKIDFDKFEVENGDSVVIERILPRFENLVSVEGAIFRPGEYSLDNNKTLSQLIESAEGLKEDALIGRISIIRTNDNLSVENISVNYVDIKTGKTPDIPLKRLDNIVVPSIFDLTEAATIRIQGAINNPAAIEGVAVPFVKNMTIEDILVQVGGFTEAASLSRIEIVRRKRNVDPNAADGQISDIYHFDILPDLSVPKAANQFVLLPYDEIFVRTSPNYKPQTFASLEGEVLYPDKYGISTKDEKISDLIKRAGGITPQAYIEGATLIRQIQLSDAEIAERNRRVMDITQSGVEKQVIQVEEVDNTKQEAIGINLRHILENPGSVDDMILVDGDIIRIPKRLETVRIQGEVLYPTSVKFLQQKQFMDYISEAGGFTRRSLKSKAYVLYANGSVDRTRRFLLVNVYPKIEPGSEVIVPLKTENTQQQLSQFQSLLGTIISTAGTVATLFGILRLSGK